MFCPSSRNRSLAHVVLESPVRDQVAGDARRGGGRRQPAPPRPRADRADLARRRRHHRRRHLRHDRRNGGQRGGSRRPRLVPGRRVRLRSGRLLLRRVRLDGPRGRQRLHLRLRHARRADRVDHRLGPDPRIRDERRSRGGVVVAVSQQASRSLQPAEDPAISVQRSVHHGGGVVQPAGGAGALLLHRRPGHRHPREPRRRTRSWSSSSSASSSSSSSSASSS